LTKKNANYSNNVEVDCFMQVNEVMIKILQGSVATQMVAE